uniref:OSJNBa0079F16.13 protein n=1 Tax=Oryza sativa subsp. japonica TaxID=39947 RepID=Q7XX08_ORYSJ|nr:OSJNBa0079F16.13 [Oryza sativa Japonica Group]
MSGVTSMSPTAGARSDASPEPESESESGVPNIGTEDPCQNAVQIPEDNDSQVNVRPKESHYVRNCPWKVFARSPEKDEKQCPGSNQAPSQSTDKKDGTLQPNSGANRTVIWKMDNGRTMIITGSEFTPEDAARIPKRQRGRNTFRGARQLTRHLIKYGPPRPEDDESGERFSADDDDDNDDDNDENDDATLDSFRERELKFKACARCGIVGHTASLCLPTCRCGEYTHYSDACPLRKVTCFLCEGTDHVPKDCQLNAVIAKTKKEQGTTVQPIRQPMTIDNSGHNPSALPPTPAPVEANHGRSNVTKDVHKSLLVPVSAAKVHNQKPAPWDQASRSCRNCRKPGHCFSDCPLPRAAKAVRRDSQVTSTAHDTNRHLNVQPPPQRIIVKGTVKGRIVPPAIVSSLQHQRQQGKQCQENNSSLQLQRGSTLLRQHPRQASSAPGHPAVVSSSNAPRIAPIQRPIGKSPLGNPASKKFLPAAAVKRVVTPPSKINKQSNIPGETSASRN